MRMKSPDPATTAAALSAPAVALLALQPDRVRQRLRRLWRPLPAVSEAVLAVALLLLTYRAVTRLDTAPLLQLAIGSARMLSAAAGMMPLNGWIAGLGLAAVAASPGVPALYAELRLRAADAVVRADRGLVAGSPRRRGSEEAPAGKPVAREVRAA